MTTLARVDVYDNTGKIILSKNDDNYDEKLKQIQNTPTVYASQNTAASAPATSAMSNYTPQSIVDVYEVLAPTATDYANANLERAGQAQTSYGPLAQAAMGDSQTAGIGNYTYNRLVRPAVNTMRDQLIVEGYSAALNKQLSDTLNKAKENYNRAARRYSRGGGGGGGGGNNGGNDGVKIDEEEIPENLDNSGNKVPENPNVNDYISSGYSFLNYGNLPGQNRKYPLAVDTPNYSTSYDVFNGPSDPFARAKAWVDYLYSIGYGG